MRCKSCCYQIPLGPTVPEGHQPAQLEVACAGDSPSFCAVSPVFHIFPVQVPSEERHPVLCAPSLPCPLAS